MKAKTDRIFINIYIYIIYLSTHPFCCDASIFFFFFSIFHFESQAVSHRIINKLIEDTK